MLKRWVGCCCWWWLVCWFGVVWSEVDNCPNANNCTRICTQASPCVNGMLNCPTGTVDHQYVCNVTCLEANACSNYTINAGNYVSQLSFVTVPEVETYAMKIISKAKSVLLQCEGAACVQTTLSINNADSALVLCNSKSSITACMGGVWSFTQVQTVSVSCFNKNSCSENQVHFSGVNNLNWVCTDTTSCESNNVTTYQTGSFSLACKQQQSCTSSHWNSINDDNVMLTYPVITATELDTWSIQSAKNLSIIGVDQAIYLNTFQLSQVQTFLLQLTDYARTPLTTWNRESITNLYLQEYNSESHWLTAGEQGTLNCGMNKPCYIRSDIDRAHVTQQMDIYCAKNMSNVCHLYCAGTESCVAVRLYSEYNTLVHSYNTSRLIVTAIPSEYRNGSKLEVQCAMAGCQNALINSNGVSDVVLYCDGNKACESAFVTMTEVHWAYITCKGNMACTGLLFTHLVESIEGFLYVVSNGSSSMQDSEWYMGIWNNIDFNCMGPNSCRNLNMHGTGVHHSNVICDGKYGTPCDNAVFNISGVSNSSLTCLEGSSASGCYAVEMVCPYPTDNSSCNIDCSFKNGIPSSIPSCNQVSIFTTSNNGFGDPINLTCVTTEQTKSCEDVVIYCGKRYDCSCFVIENEQNQWYCPGECGTEECEEDDDSSGSKKLSPGLIALAVILPVLALVALIAVGIWLWTHRRKQQELALLGVNNSKLATKYDTY